MEQKEKKKRVRPTVAQVKSLEERIGTLEDENRMLSECSVAKAEYDHLKSCYDVQCHHYKLMSDRLDELRNEYNELEKYVDDAKREVEYLRNRGFWARVFNRK